MLSEREVTIFVKRTQSDDHSAGNDIGTFPGQGSSNHLLNICLNNERKMQRQNTGMSAASQFSLDYKNYLLNQKLGRQKKKKTCAIFSKDSVHLKLKKAIAYKTFTLSVKQLSIKELNQIIHGEDLSVVSKTYNATMCCRLLCVVETIKQK